MSSALLIERQGAVETWTMNDPATRNALSDAMVLALFEACLRAKADSTLRGVVLRGANSYLERIAASANGERLAPRDCAPGRDFLFIDEAGRIAPCAQTPREYGVAVDSLDSPASLTALPGRFSHARRQCRAPACAVVTCRAPSTFPTTSCSIPRPAR